MRFQIVGMVTAAALTLALLAPVSEMRADVLFSNFGSGQTYVGNSWWDVGNSPSGAQVIAFSFTPTETAMVTGADLAVASLSGSTTSLSVDIESSSAGAPGVILDTLTQVGSYSPYPTTSVVNFSCSGSCTTLDAGTTYWIVAQQTDPENLTAWMYSSGDTGAWYYNEENSAAGSWTTATAGNTFSAFDVTGTPSVPEPTSGALLGSGLVGVLAATRRRFWRR
jgi:PEP-CTERM motif